MHGNSHDLGFATQDSMAIMQYMGTEYEAMIGTSLNSGGEMMMDNIWNDLMAEEQVDEVG